MSGFVNNGYFDFNGLSNGTAIDTSVNAPENPFAAIQGGANTWTASTSSPFEGSASGLNTLGAGVNGTYGYVNIGGSGSRFALGLAFKFSALPTLGSGFWSIFYAGGFMALNSTGHILLNSGGTSGTVFTSTTALSTGTWYYLEFAYTPSATVARLELNIWSATGSLIESYDSGASLAGANVFPTFLRLMDGGNNTTSSTAWNVSWDAFAGDVSLPAGSFPSLVNTFEGQSSGTTLTTSNGGGSSAGLGRSGAAFHTVSTGTGVTAQFSSTKSMKGNQSLALALTDTQAGYFGWTHQANSNTARWAARTYVNFGDPGSTSKWAEDIVQIWSSGNVPIGAIRTDSTGNLQVYNYSGTSTGTLASSATYQVSANTWYRAELAVTPGTTTSNGTVDYAVYVGDSSTAVWSGSLTSVNTNAKVNASRFGRTGTTGYYARTNYFDDPAAYPMASGFIGISATPPVGSSPALTGSGTLGSSATVTASGTATLTGSGSLTTAASPATSVSVALSGAGSLGASGAPTLTTTGSVGANAQVSATSVNTLVTTGHVDANAATSATASAAPTVFPALTGSGALTATGSNPSPKPSVVLTGSGTLAASSTATLATTGSVSANGALSALAEQPITVETTGHVDATARLGAVAFISYEVSGTLPVNVTSLEALAVSAEVTVTTDETTGSSTDGTVVVAPYSALGATPAAVLGTSSGLPTTTAGLIPHEYLPSNTGLSIRILTPAPDLQVIDMVPTYVSANILDEIKGDGSGSFKVSVDDPRFSETPELANYLNVAQVAVDGVICGAFLLKNVHRQLVGTGENAQVVFEFSGPGLREWFRHAVVYPENHNHLPLESLQPGTRYFNFSSPQGNWYNAADWTFPTRMVQVRDTTVGWTAGSTSGNPWGTSPVGWPDVQNQSVFWVWDRDTRPSAPPTGDVYFRREFATTDTRATYTLFVTADSSFQAYIDGVPISAQNLKDSWHYLWEGAIDLGPGTHVLAIKASNYDNTSPAGMACLLYKNGTTADAVLAGDTNTNVEAQLLAWSGDPYWKCLGYPARAPGWTAGDVLSTLIQEGKDRGVAAMQRLELTFTPSADSNGEVWTEPLDWTFDIGLTYYDVVTRLEELACEVYVDPATFQVYAYNKQGTDRSVQTSTSQAVEFKRGHNVLTATEDSQVNFVNSFLVSYGDTKIAEVVDTYNQIPTVGRIEGYAATDSSYDKKTATSVANKMLELGKDPLDSATVTITDVEDHTPWKDFRVGDWVLGPGATGQRQRRVVSIAAAADDKTGNPVFEVELDSRSQDMNDKIARYLARIPAFAALGTALAAGSTGGVTGGGGPVDTGGGGVVTPPDPGTGGGVTDPTGGPVDPGPIPEPYIPPPGGFGTGLAVYVQPFEPDDHSLGVLWYDTDG